MAWATFAQGSPEAFHLANALVLAGYTLSRRGFCLQTMLEQVHLSLWFALLGDSGAGKTTTIDMAEKFALDVWAEAGLDVGRPFVEPSGSIAGILAALADHYDSHRGTTAAILQHDELAQIFVNKREPIAELLCKLHDGRDVHYNTRTAQKGKTKGSGYDRLIAPRLCAIFASTEAQLAPYFQAAHRDGGMFGRLQWLRPVLSSRYVRATAYRPEDVQEAHLRRQTAVTAWADWEGRLSELAGSSGTAMALEPDASEYLDTQLFQVFRSALDVTANTDHLHGARMRLVRRTTVMAAIFAVSQLRLQVTLDDVQMAVQMGMKLYGHSVAAADLGSSEHNRLCAKVEEVVLAAGERGAYRKEIYYRVRVTKKQMDEIIETLIDRERIAPDRHSGVVERYVHTSTQIGQRAINVEHKSREIADVISIQRAAKKPGV